MPTAKLTDHVIALVLLAAIALIGAIVLAALGQSVPDALWIIAGVGSGGASGAATPRRAAP